MIDPRHAILSQELESVPEHVAIIMDGNNRWAKHNDLSGVAGHKAGVDAVKSVIETAVHYQIPALTLFAFSSENWRRPELEVRALMELFVYVLKREVTKLHDNNIRLRIIGDAVGLSSELQQLIAAAEEKTKLNTGLQLNIAVNYGGRWDIVQAAKTMAQDASLGGDKIASMTEKDFAKYLCLGDLPEVDLCIRTSGEQRISNFLLWQIAYAELYFSEVLWPDFNKEHFEEAITSYQKRERRFGKTSEQLIS
jgi:undecaprenyl diphosphate synthase